MISLILLGNFTIIEIFTQTIRYTISPRGSGFFALPIPIRKHAHEIWSRSDRQSKSYINACKALKGTLELRSRKGESISTDIVPWTWHRYRWTDVFFLPRSENCFFLLHRSEQYRKTRKNRSRVMISNIYRKHPLILMGIDDFLLWCKVGFSLEISENHLKS